MENSIGKTFKTDIYDKLFILSTLKNQIHHGIFIIKMYVCLQEI